ncbi:MAG: CHAD domain-containing protein [Eubacteriales bacterium]|nr:CHAD domain-containing protein [Eubacteriales bacterium]
MERRLILIRHGKADSRETVPDETRRELTKQGIKEIEKLLPALQGRLCGLQLRFYTSALPRASQTADIITDYMEAEPAERAEWVENGNFEGLLSICQNLDPHLTPVVVGHEPHLSAWCRQLCGYEIPFRKGGAVGLRVIPQPLSAKPEWTLLPGRLKVNRGGEALPEFRKILRFKCHEVFARLQNFLANPGDADAVHRFRIEVRTLRAMLSFIKPLIKPEQYADASDMTEAVFNVLRLTENEAEQAEESSKPISFKAFTEKRIASRLKKINAALDTIGDSDYAAIHELRKQIKKLRYAIEAVNPILGMKRENTIASLKNLQDLFGDYCDTQLNLAIIGELSEREDNDEMRRESALMSGYQIRLAEEKLEKIRTVGTVR